MKAEHRHNLKTNELAKWLANFPQWADENIKIIIYAAVVIILVIAAGAWRYYSKNVSSTDQQIKFTSIINSLPKGKNEIITAQANGIDYSYMLLKMADILTSFTREAKNDQMAAVALIRRAELFRIDLHYRLTPPTPQEKNTQLENAKTSYQKALEKAGSDTSLISIAKLGLGLCEEEQGNFDAAGQIYQQITKDTSLAGTTAFSQAKLRLETMDEYKQPVTFRPAPIALPAQTPEPVKILPADINKPDSNS